MQTLFGAVSEESIPERLARALRARIAQIRLKRRLKATKAPLDHTDPDEPYALVGARLRPRKPLNSAAAAVQLEP